MALYRSAARPARASAFTSRLHGRRPSPYSRRRLGNASRSMARANPFANRGALRGTPARGGAGMFGRITGQAGGMQGRPAPRSSYYTRQLGNNARNAKLRNAQLQGAGSRYGAGQRQLRGAPARPGLDRAQPFQQARAKIAGNMGGARPASPTMDRAAYSNNAAPQVGSQRQGAQGNTMRASPFSNRGRGGI